MVEFDDFLTEQTALIFKCYYETTGRSLFDRLGLSSEQINKELAKALFHSGTAVLSHDLEVSPQSRDNVYNYANATALRVFERTWEEQTAIPSSKSVGKNDPLQAKRNALLASCIAKGFVEFEDERFSSSGKTVKLKNAVLFNLFDQAGCYRGQAVVFDPE